MRRIMGVAAFLAESAGPPRFTAIEEDRWWQLVESEGQERLTRRERDEINRIGGGLFERFTLTRLQRFRDGGRDYSHYTIFFVRRRPNRPGLESCSVHLTDDGWFMVAHLDPGTTYKCDGFAGLVDLLRHIAGEKNS